MKYKIHVTKLFDTFFHAFRIWIPLCKKCPYLELLWSVFSHIRTEYGEILRISPYSIWMRENTDQNNSEYVHFSRSVLLLFWSTKLSISVYVHWKSALKFQNCIINPKWCHHKKKKEKGKTTWKVSEYGVFYFLYFLV